MFYMFGMLKFQVPDRYLKFQHAILPEVEVTYF